MFKQSTQPYSRTQTFPALQAFVGEKVGKTIPPIRQQSRQCSTAEQGLSSGVHHTDPLASALEMYYTPHQADWFSRQSRVELFCCVFQSQYGV